MSDANAIMGHEGIVSTGARKVKNLRFTDDIVRLAGGVQEAQGHHKMPLPVIH